MSQQPSSACCTVSPATADHYEPKGKYIDLKDGMKCYVTGPSTASKAILIIFDIFGYSPQTIQGADILAHADDPDHQYRVYMPDFFYGEPFSKKDFPPDTPEKKKALGDFFSGPAKPDAAARKVLEVVHELNKNPDGAAKDGVGAGGEGGAGGSGFSKWASLGMCWGGKIVSLTAQEGTPFAAAAEVHPAMVDPEDAKGVKIPMCMLASKDEDKEAVSMFEENLKTNKHVETFGDQVHGWMAARADLKDGKVKEQYERGYKTLLDFYRQYL